MNDKIRHTLYASSRGSTPVTSTPGERRMTGGCQEVEARLFCQVAVTMHPFLRMLAQCARISCLSCRLPAGEEIDEDDFPDHWNSAREPAYPLSVRR